MIAKHVGILWLHNHTIVPAEMGIIVYGIVVDAEVVCIRTETIVIYKRYRGKNQGKNKK